MGPPSDPPPPHGFSDFPNEDFLYRVPPKLLLTAEGYATGPIWRKGMRPTKGPI